MMLLRLLLGALMLSSITALFSQDEDPPSGGTELELFNNSTGDYPDYTTRDVTIRIYPISMLFNGRNHYDLHTKVPDNEGYFRYHYLTGASE